jgi:flagellin
MRYCLAWVRASLLGECFMGLRIFTNMAALQASRIVNQTSENQMRNYQRLASGQRIIQAVDDPAGLSISESMRTEIRSLGQAERNANDAVSLIQVSEGALSEVGNILIRLRELAIEAASDTIGNTERGFINDEAKGLVEEIDRLANVTEYNRIPLLNGQATPSILDFQVGTKNSPDNRISLDTQLYDSRVETLGVSNLNYESIDAARDSLEMIDTAMTKVFSNRASLGALQNRLQTAVKVTAITKENLSAARSRISDLDVVAEATDLVKNNILQLAGVAVLAQANTFPSHALELLKSS